MSRERLKSVCTVYGVGPFNYLLPDASTSSRLALRVIHQFLHHFHFYSLSCHFWHPCKYLNLIVYLVILYFGRGDSKDFLISKSHHIIWIQYCFVFYLFYTFVYFVHLYCISLWIVLIALRGKISDPAKVGSKHARFSRLDCFYR